jgi:hypothetical protein
MEWGAEATAERQFAGVLEKELTLDQVIEQAPGPLPAGRPRGKRVFPACAALRNIAALMVGVHRWRRNVVAP